MKEYLRCKVCNYIMKKGNDSKICPACGVPHTAFEEYKYNISDKRKLIMELDLHPIVLHFPQAITILIPLLILLEKLTNPLLTIKLISTIEILAFILPFSVFAAFITGVFDGKNRFKKISTPHLMKKIFLSTVLLIITIAITILAFNKGVASSINSILILSIIGSLIQIILARIGIKLMFSYIPGK